VVGVFVGGRWRWCYSSKWSGRCVLVLVCWWFCVGCCGGSLVCSSIAAPPFCVDESGAPYCGLGCFLNSATPHGKGTHIRLPVLPALTPHTPL